MTFRIGPYRIEAHARYVRTNRRRAPLVRARYVAALLALLLLCL